MSGGNEKLLPCPFCGGEAKLRDSRIFEKVPNWVAFCPVGHAMTPSYGEKDKAIKAWNTRAKPTLSLPRRKEIRKNFQKVVDKGKGDCFRACITSLLGIENKDEYPTAENKNWFIFWTNFLKPFGLRLAGESRAMWREGFWIAYVKSKNYLPEENISHAILMKGDCVYFDPSTKKRYKEGESLLGEEVVSYCQYLEVVDPRKLNFDETAKSLQEQGYEVEG